MVNLPVSLIVSMAKSSLVLRLLYQGKDYDILLRKHMEETSD